MTADRIETAIARHPGSLSGADQRLHPLTLLLNLAKLVPQLALGLIALNFSMKDRAGEWAGPIALAAIVLILGFEFIRWWRFSYRLDAEELRIASGIINRNIRSIPYERIQDVNLEQGPLARMLGMARVRLETGSSGSGDEGVLDAVDLAEAGRLRDIIRLRKANTTEAFDEDRAAIDLPDAATIPIFAMDTRRVLIAGVFNFSLVFFALVGALVNNLDFVIPGDVWNPRRLLEFFGFEEMFAALDVTARIIGIIAALVALVIIGLGGGIIRSVLREHRFRLDRTETGFRRRRGLLTLTDVVMPLHRIQAAVIETGPIRRRLGWYHLKVQSLASDTEKESDHSIAPLARSHEVQAILGETQVRWAIDHPQMQPVDPAMWWVQVALLLPIPAIGIAVAATLASPFLLLLLGLLPIIPVSGWLGWRAHRYALSDGQLYVRDGFWSQRLTLLPVRRVQSVDIRQNVIGRFIGLADIAIGVAGRSSAVKIHAIPLVDALNLRKRLVAVSVRSRPRCP